MVNPHQHSPCENTYISPGRYQHKGNRTLGTMEIISFNTVRMEFIIQLSTMETHTAAELNTLGIVSV